MANLSTQPDDEREDRRATFLAALEYGASPLVARAEPAGAPRSA